MLVAQPGRAVLRVGFVDEVFWHLAQSVLREGADEALMAERLWRLPEVTTRFVHRAVTDRDIAPLEPPIHRLRLAAAEVINTRLDRSAVKRERAGRLAAAARHIRFRPWRPDEAATLRALLDSERLWATMPDEYPAPVTETLADQLIAIANGWSARHTVSAVEWDGETVGQVRLQFDSSPFADSAEISYWLGESYWGRGMGSEIVGLYTADSFRRLPQIDHLFANVLEPNAASLRVLQKAGYRREAFRYRNVAKAGRSCSTHVWGVCRKEYE